MRFPALKIPNAVDVLEDELEHMIFSGAIRPGTSLPAERQLAEELGVSRTTLREAFSRLRAKGLMHSEAGRHSVPDIINFMLLRTFQAVDAADGGKLFEILKYTVSGMGRLALGKANQSDRDDIADAARQLILAVEQDEVAEQGEAFYHLLMCVAEASYNFFGIQVVHALLGGFAEFMERGFTAFATQPKLKDKFCRSADNLKELSASSTKNTHALFESLAQAATNEGFNPRFDARTKESSSTPQEIAFEKIHNRILQNVYAVGELLPTTKTFSKQLGLSEDAIKLAFHRLEAHGLVSLEKLGRARVVSLKELSAIDALTDAILKQRYAMEATFEFRLMLEEWSADLAAQNITPKKAEKLTSIFKNMTAAVEKNPIAYGKLDIRFHKMIARICGNPALGSMLESFWVVMERVTADWLRRHAGEEEYNAEIHLQHKRIYDAVVAGEGSAASKAMRMHLEYVLKKLRAMERQEKFQAMSNVRLSLRSS